MALRIQVPKYKVSIQNRLYDSEYRIPKYPIIVHFGLLGWVMVWRWHAGLQHHAALRFAGESSKRPQLSCLQVSGGYLLHFHQSQSQRHLQMELVQRQFCMVLLRMIFRLWWPQSLPIFRSRIPIRAFVSHALNVHQHDIGNQ